MSESGTVKCDKNHTVKLMGVGEFLSGSDEHRFCLFIIHDSVEICFNIVHKVPFRQTFNKGLNLHCEQSNTHSGL